MRRLTAAVAAFALAALTLSGIAPGGTAPASAATVEEPVLLGSIGDGSAWIGDQIAVGDLVYFVVNIGFDSAEVWYSDGEDVSRIASFERADQLVLFEGDVYLGARQDATHDGLWRVTTTGVTLVSAHDGTGAQPAVEELVAGDSALFYYTWSGESDENSILWSWDGDTATDIFEAGSISTVMAVGDTVVFTGGDSTVGGGLWWWSPGASLDRDSTIDYVEEFAVVGDTILMLAESSVHEGLWTWDATDHLDFLEELSEGYELVQLDDRAIASGVGVSHNGLWSWDGTTLTTISHEFTDSIYNIEALGDTVYFYAIDDDHSGYWKIEGSTASFVWAGGEPWLMTAFGDKLLLAIGCCSPQPLYAWDGTDAAPALLKDDFDYIDQMVAADGYALVLAHGETGLEAWTLGMDSLASIALTPSSTTVAAGSSVTFSVEGFDDDEVSLGDKTAEASFVSVPAATSVSGSTLTFEAAGTYEVTASIGSVSATAQVVVTSAALDSIRLSTTATGLIVGDTADFTVEGFDAYGNSLGDLSSAAAFSTDPASATVSGSAITFDEAGEFEVTARVGALEDRLMLQVDEGVVESIALRLSATTVAVGGQLTFTVDGLNANGVAIEDLTASATVVSDHPSDEIVGNTITFPHASRHVLTATAGQFQDQAVVEVTPAELGFTGVGPWWLGALVALLLAGLGTVLLVRRRGMPRVRRQS